MSYFYLMPSFIVQSAFRIYLYSETEQSELIVALTFLQINFHRSRVYRATNQYISEYLIAFGGITFCIGPL